MIRVPARVGGVALVAAVLLSVSGCTAFVFGPTGSCAPAVAASAAPATTLAASGLARYGGDCGAAGSGATFVSAGEFALGDDYPWASSPANVFNSITGYYFRNCTDFVAWRVNRDAGVTAAEARSGHLRFAWGDLTPRGGAGWEWGLPGNMPGWERTTAAVPGDVISIHQAGVFLAATAEPGHVVYVGAVADDGSILTEGYDATIGYLRSSASAAQVAAWVASGAITVLHNPENSGSTAIQTVVGAKQYAASKVTDGDEFACLVQLWTRESGWRWNATNTGSGAYGIPQALPASKMSAAGADWQTNAATQIDWGLSYIADRYGTPCAAWKQETREGWY